MGQQAAAVDAPASFNLTKNPREEKGGDVPLAKESGSSSVREMPPRRVGLLEEDKQKSAIEERIRQKLSNASARVQAS